MTKTTPMPPPKKTIARKHYRLLADDLSQISKKKQFIQKNKGHTT